MSDLAHFSDTGRACMVDVAENPHTRRTAVAGVALLTIYDMCKAIDHGMRIEYIQLEEKRGSKSGVWSREEVAKKSK